jgi:hypothetical protein
MSKEMISIPTGNLLSVAATKSVTTLSALKEKTGVDRKTLRAINEGQPVKTTTLQSIADRLRVPLTHFHGFNAADKVENVSAITPYEHRDIELQQLDASALRRIASETDEINWLLKINRMPEELEALLLKLGKSLHAWFMHDKISLDPEANDNLADQIEGIKMSIEIDTSIEEFKGHGLKLFGSTYVRWQKTQPGHPYEGYLLPILTYTSRSIAALSIVPKEKSNLTVRVHVGCEPPQKFDESTLTGIDTIYVDDVEVWSRKKRALIDQDDDIPF